MNGSPRIARAHLFPKGRQCKADQRTPARVIEDAAHDRKTEEDEDGFHAPEDDAHAFEFAVRNAYGFGRRRHGLGSRREDGIDDFRTHDERESAAERHDGGSEVAAQKAACEPDDEKADRNGLAERARDPSVKRLVEAVEPRRTGSPGGFRQKEAENGEGGKAKDARGELRGAVFVDAGRQRARFNPRVGHGIGKRGSGVGGRHCVRQSHFVFLLQMVCT